MISDGLKQFLSEINKRSKFEARLSDRGGYITFSNTSGKDFVLGLDSYIGILKDITNNIGKFSGHTNYVEGEWRDLAGEFYTDKAANAIATVQTKPLFTTISKLISWANNMNITDFHDNIINLDPNALKSSIEKIEELAQSFAPSTNNMKSPLKSPENVIYYGAPGTGKSYKINEILTPLQSEYFERVTFHPEYDNASFIGGYKPVSVKNEDKTYGIQYKFVPQAFVNIYQRAWKDLDNQYYLVIEEINRGNCAEIFGEIFQLLDRNANYTVTPSSELNNYLIEEAFGNKDHDGIKNGLKLPPNLTILATMNTSDQSLFPMDSAFKRRWTWEYIPICYGFKDDFGGKNASFDYEIEIETGYQYQWIKFIEIVNINHIKNNPSLGMDKCIGNYFIKPHSGTKISLNEFVNKVIFYLWNDVFKDEENNVFEQNTSYEDFFPIRTNGKTKVLELFERIGLSKFEGEQDGDQDAEQYTNSES